MPIRKQKQPSEAKVVRIGFKSPREINQAQNLLDKLGKKGRAR